MGINNVEFDNVAPAVLPSGAFSIEGGRLAAIQRPTGEELCLKQGWISLPLRAFQPVKGRISVMGQSVTGARSYTFRTGSNALGGTG